MAGARAALFQKKTEPIEGPESLQKEAKVAKAMPEVCGVCGGTYVRQMRQGLDVIVCDECGIWHAVDSLKGGAK